MRRIVLRGLVFLLLQAALIAWLVAPYRPNPEIFWAGTVMKNDRLRDTPGPRLVFVGGSNLAFSLDSAQVEAALPYQAVNMGLDAQLGLDFLLREVSGPLRRGDVVVLSPEAQEFLGWRRGQVFSLARVLEQRPASVAFLGPGGAATLLDQGFSFFHWVFVNARKGLDRQPIRGVYSAAAFEEHGDAVLHLDKHPRGAKIPRTLEEVWRTGRVDRGALGSLERFAAGCRARGVRVFLSHPPLPAYYTEETPAIRAVEEAVYRRTTIPVLDRQADMFFPLEEFFDTEYHLLRAGRAERTRRLVARLAARLYPAGQEFQEPMRLSRSGVNSSSASPTE